MCVMVWTLCAFCGAGVVVGVLGGRVGSVVGVVVGVLGGRVGAVVGVMGSRHKLVP